MTVSLRREIAMNMKKANAEFIGTFALVLIGCGAAVIGGMGSGATSIDILGIAAAFGLTIVAMGARSGRRSSAPRRTRCATFLARNLWMPGTSPGHDAF
jgi:hypothetical protein